MTSSEVKAIPPSYEAKMALTGASLSSVEQGLGWSLQDEARARRKYDAGCISLDFVIAC